MLPWPVCPLAGHARLGQNVVAGSMRLLLSWLCWGACQEGVCLDPHFHCNCTAPRFSGELPITLIPEIIAFLPGKLPFTCSFRDLSQARNPLPQMSSYVVSSI